MILGVPTEVKNKENRVAATPAGVRTLTAQGHRVLVQAGAGQGSGFSDEAYSQAGAEIIAQAADVWTKAELILKVKEPVESEYAYLRPGLILFTYLHLAAVPELARVLIEKQVTAIAYETVQDGKRLPLLEPMSEIAGRMASIVGAYHLSTTHGGKGVLLGGVPGVLPGRVLILGGGTSGVNACRMAQGLGAEVTILEVDHEKMRNLDLSLHSAVHTLFSNEYNLMEILPRVDLLIGAVLIPGSRAPKLISRHMLKLLRPGSVFVDIAIDQGGCAETSRPTTHDTPTYIEEGVLHYCVTNMPGAYARTATQALTNSTLPYALKLATLGWKKALELDPSLAHGLNTHDGALRHPGIAEALPELPIKLSS